MKSRLFAVQNMKSRNINMPVIGVLGVTIPGATDCINKINQHCHQYFSHHEHPDIILVQSNFLPIHEAQNADRWDIVENRLADGLIRLGMAGADFAIIPANTVHKVISSLQQNSPLPLVSMLDVVTNTCVEAGLKKVGVMGTRWTMGNHLYFESFNKKNILEVLPSKEDQDIIHHAIFDELIPYGKVKDITLNALLVVVENLKREGCDGVALACTELPLVLNKENCGLAIVDTTNCLAEYAVRHAFNMSSNKLHMQHKL